MAIKSILGSFLITLFIPLTSIASPSGKYRPAGCEVGQSGQKSCQVKYNYLGRMEYWQMTIRWPDGTVTKLKRPTGDSSAPWSDYFGREWAETSVTVERTGLTDLRKQIFHNMSSRELFKIIMHD